LNFAEIFHIRKLESLSYGVALLRDPMFSRFRRTSRTPTCRDRQMDRQTNT